MLEKIIKATMYSIGVIGMAQIAVGCDHDRDTQPSTTYVVYEVAQVQPQTVRYATQDYYTRTVEYRCVTECDRRTYLPDPPMRSIRNAYIDPYSR